MTSTPGAGKPKEPVNSQRRGFLSLSSNLAMLAGLIGGYGAFAYIAARFLYPVRPQRKRWMFVAEASRVKEGESLLYQMPAAATVNVTRQGASGGAADFIALSSVCPHLGCQVHWEPNKNRYFCPCHNGTFDASGKGTSGPPGEAGLSLPRYELKVEKGLLYIEVPVSALTDVAEGGKVADSARGIHGPGHDPCLTARGARVSRRKDGLKES
ncbi:MAG: ubiquinol-cytochrome c reductase iron-sulfur subunit [Terriglobia bacterium]